tara:strand:- start:2760 stop:2864 length:105 start_codon:yes stop_codon:yes gene_type:complete
LVIDGGKEVVRALAIEEKGRLTRAAKGLDVASVA